MTPFASTAEAPRRVGVVGPGLMGLGLAQACAAAGFEVALCGRDAAAARERFDDALPGLADFDAPEIRDVERTLGYTYREHLAIDLRLPFVGDALRCDPDGPRAANGRGLATARLYAQSGEMAASATQECLLAPA